MPGSVAVVGNIVIKTGGPLKVERSKNRMQAGLYEFSKNGKGFHSQWCIFSACFRLDLNMCLHAQN